MKSSNADNVKNSLAHMRKEYDLYQFNVYHLLALKKNEKVKSLLSAIRPGIALELFCTRDDEHAAKPGLDDLKKLINDVPNTISVLVLNWGFLQHLAPAELEDFLKSIPENITTLYLRPMDNIGWDFTVDQMKALESLPKHIKDFILQFAPKDSTYHHDFKTTVFNNFPKNVTGLDFFHTPSRNLNPDAFNRDVLPNVKKLDFNESLCDVAFVTALIMEFGKQLRTLDISNDSYIWQDSVLDGLEASQLKELLLKNVTVEDDLELIFSALPMTLEKLNLASNGLDQHMELLKECAKFLPPNLVEIDISENNIGANEAHGLFPASVKNIIVGPAPQINAEPEPPALVAVSADSADTQAKVSLELINIKKQIKKAVELYKAYYDNNRLHAFFSGHFTEGQNRAESWRQKIESLDSLPALKGHIIQYLEDSDMKNGRTDVYSFRTILLACVKDGLNELNQDRLTRVSEGFNGNLSALKTGWTDAVVPKAELPGYK
ncbi:hypothetical protein ACFORL_11200 [Legionella dresdenensis]|uniref:Leucine-rich repeat-containing protein n=1 Tax=Legionella dresdenensis TaxID=450200 RepID=A0ABV8CHE7_9GAMM